MLPFIQFSPNCVWKSIVVLEIIRRHPWTSLSSIASWRGGVSTLPPYQLSLPSPTRLVLHKFFIHHMWFLSLTSLIFESSSFTSILNIFSTIFHPGFVISASFLSLCIRYVTQIRFEVKQICMLEQFTPYSSWKATVPCRSIHPHVVFNHCNPIVNESCKNHCDGSLS